MNFIAEKSYWNLFPNSKLGVLVLKNIQNGESNEDIKNLLAEANDEAKKYLVKEVLSENPVISVWREAYKKFKTKKGVRCSIEALLKRVSQGNPVQSINMLVDIYNSASLKYGLPCGAEDLDTFVGNLKLTITNGGDKFIPLGSDEEDNTLPNELCYIDDAGAVCRCFNWRDGLRTMVKNDTKNVFLIMELVDDRVDDLNLALDFITEYSKQYLNADIERYVLDINNNEICLK